ncbi:hypothetical protein [Deinococcus soli (ex Cha et al. 2016)]|uniref:Uncharacterized protein n=2 Tax=Deinococcus soli (ex Cha et al. 2016) TaxID=1309411 RepID=A0ACC6KHG3_9DEIO|nr:hypothetical protein [Deinococcus soli (ex Cha et al. 2016)]MDR6218800.1 hypothetical protein [Deinococcus soli (ex Cha et al. 2016)]MDR6328597.1 hypothetical protein [Deinococcus soli (ex Cha et al. 2016)]MDR6751916.1 hypothetical protein [Deinococcus soli (ex Cha et al. 2016)]
MLNLPLALHLTLSEPQQHLIEQLRHDQDNSEAVTTLADDHPELLITLVRGLLDGALTGPDVILGDLVEALGEGVSGNADVHGLLLRALRHPDEYVQRTGLDALVTAHRGAEVNLALLLTDADWLGIRVPLRSLLPADLRPLTVPAYVPVTDAEWALLRGLSGHPDEDDAVMTVLAETHAPLLIQVLRAAAERHPHVLIRRAVLANLVTALGWTELAPATTRQILSRLLDADDLLIQERALRALLARLEGGDEAVRLLLPERRLRALPETLVGYWQGTYARALALDADPWQDDEDGRMEALHGLVINVHAEGYWPQRI